MLNPGKATDGFPQFPNVPLNPTILVEGSCKVVTPYNLSLIYINLYREIGQTNQGFYFFNVYSNLDGSQLNIKVVYFAVLLAGV